MNDAILNESNDIYSIAESKANRFNVKCMTLIAFLSVFCLGLNELRVFSIPRVTMMVTMSISFVIFIAPAVLYLINDIILKKKSICFSYAYKVMIVAFTYLGVGAISVALSFHAIMLLAIPPLMGAQYHYNKKMTIFIFVASLILVPMSVYGSLYLGLPDRNLLKETITYEQALDVAQRVKVISSGRLISVLLHYVFPRLLALMSINVLALGISKRNARMLEKQKDLQDVAQAEMKQKNEMQIHVIEDLAGVIETRDVGTGEHVIRTKKYVGVIARELQKHPEYMGVLTDKEIDEIENAAPLHDIGKIAIPDSILLKPGRFTPEEFEIMKRHSEKGGEMVDSIFVNLGDKPFLDKAYDIAVSHHEKWDGSGYPNGLKGEEIPLSARIMAIADVYDALVSKRVYKNQMAPHEAFQIILKDAGTHFDPHIVEYIKDMEGEFAKIATTPVEQPELAEHRSA